ncbi:WXG100 family type VII secretion target [Paenibacillus sp. ov031]|uniref:WXG100 family type VII secretion target n=1 Tax=Paenibacillus sp. ov031 TaxID=1761879 RepID=UPI000922AEDD|nr:WXG100 family type VII secretion target [Paenibacillus sp. ov031]SHN80669.1 WXG100 family type VII secretion target [Paenibacillus sp. ov031]
MTTIKVTPEQLLSVSRQFEAAQSQVFQMNSILKQHLFEIERQWDGSTKEKFYYDFTVAQKVMDNFVSLSLSIAEELQRYSEKFRLADQQALQSYDPRCAPPPPDECRAPNTDTRNAFQKSADSLAELGRDFMQSADARYQKRYDSVGGFLDYWTFGIPSGLVQGYVDRADKAFNSPNDTANWLTFGIHGTIREATFPTNTWSSEHWANIFGVGGLMLGGGYASTMIKPHNLLTSKGEGVRINSSSPPGTGDMTKEISKGTEKIDFVDETGRLGGKLYGEKDLNLLGNYLDKRGVNLKVGDEFLPPGKGGGFNYNTGELILKSNPTQYEVWHELSHYVQYKQIGKEAYSNLPRTSGPVPMNDLSKFNAPEQFVYDMLSNSPKKWNSLNEAEQLHANWYITQYGGVR